MITTQQDFAEYVKQTYPDVTENLHSPLTIFDYCPVCRARMGLLVLRRQYVECQMPGSLLAARASMRNRHPAGQQPEKPRVDPAFPSIVSFTCPQCGSFRRWIVYRVEERDYRIMSVPGHDEIDSLPADPPSLRRAYSEAIRAWGANCPMAAVVMFRRALQIITRDILKGPPARMLGNELSNLKGRPNALGITLSQDFHDNAYIVKETGNQGAHADEDPDLLDFTDADARNIHALFLDIVTELFVVPAAEKKARTDMLERRKIVLPS